MATPTQKPRIYYGWWVLGVGIASMMVSSGLNNWALGLYVQPLEDEFGWSRTQVSLGFSVSILVSGFSGPFIGKWIDRYGPRSSLLVGGVLCALSYLVLAATSSLWQWYVFFGISAAFRMMIFFIPLQALVSRWFDRRRGAAMSVMGIGYSLGGFLIVPLMAFVIDETGWRGGFVFSSALVALTYLPACLFIVRNNPGDVGAIIDGDPAPHKDTARAPVAEGMTLSQVMRLPLFWLMAFGLMLYFSGAVGWGLHIVPFLESRGLSRDSAALMVSVAAGVSIFSRVFIGVIVDRVRRFEAVIIALIASMCLSMILPLVIGGTAGLVLFLALWVVGTTAGSIAEALLLTRAFGMSSFATILGAVVVVETCGQLLTPSLAGAIFDSAGSYDLALVMFACIFAGSAAVLTLASKLPAPVRRTEVAVAVT